MRNLLAARSTLCELRLRIPQIQSLLHRFGLHLNDHIHYLSTTSAMIKTLWTIAVQHIIFINLTQLFFIDQHGSITDVGTSTFTYTTHDPEFHWHHGISFNTSTKVNFKCVISHQWPTPSNTDKWSLSQFWHLTFTAISRSHGPRPHVWWI